MAKKRLGEEPGLDRQQLVKALKTVLPGVEKRNPLSGLDTVYFDNDWVRTFNKQVSISYPIKVGIRCAIRMEELYRVISQMEGERINISLDTKSGKGKTVFKDEITTLRMTLREDVAFDEQIESLQIPDTESKKEWKTIPEDFIEGAALCIWSASTDLIRGYQAGVCFHNDQIYACDNDRMSRYVMESSMETSFLLPTVNLTSLLRIEEDIKSFSENKSWVHFLCESGGVVSLRRLVGDYPTGEMDQFFTKFKEQEEGFFSLPEKLEASIDRAWAMAESLSVDIGTAFFIFLRREKSSLVVSGRKEVGEVIDHIPWESDFPEDVEIMVNPKFLKRILVKSRDFKLADNRGTIYFETEKLNHVVAVKVVDKEGKKDRSE